MDQKERMTPSEHSDTPPARPERTTGAGAEATQPKGEIAEEHDREHRSGYGGKGGSPDASSDQR